MYFVYLIQSELDNSLYIGYTTNLKQRLNKHNQKQVTSTKNKVPWRLLYFEGFKDRFDAKNREVYLKSGWGRRSLSKILVKTLSNNLIFI